MRRTRRSPWLSINLREARSDKYGLNTLSGRAAKRSISQSQTTLAICEESRSPHPPPCAREIPCTNMEAVNEKTDCGLPE